MNPTQPSIGPGSYFIAEVLALILLLAGAFSIAGDYGVGWDDAVHSRYGELVRDYFQSGGEDRRANTYLDLYGYGTIGDLVPACIYQYFPDSKWTIRRCWSAALGIIGAFVISRISARSGSQSTSYFSGLILLMLPLYVGHSFINAKDIPFSLAMSLTMLAMIQCFSRESISWRSAFSLGAAMGLSLAIRPGSFVILIVFLISMLAISDLRHFALELLQEKPTSEKGGDPQRLFKLLFALGFAWTLMILPWPWAQMDPIQNPLQAIRTSLSFHQRYAVLFEGEYYASDSLPRRYLIEYFLITTPLSVLTLAGVGLVSKLSTIRSRLAERSTMVDLALLSWLFLPIAIWTVRTPPIYDGNRHFLFVLPAIAYWAGEGCRALLANSSKGTKPLVLSLVLVAVSIPLVDLVRLHPYQMTYLNSLAGNFPDAAQRFETDYWTTSYREGVAWINAQAEREPGRKFKVLVAANDYSRACASEFARENVEIIHQYRFADDERFPADFDFFLATTRFHWSEKYPDAPIVFRVERAGATFALVKQRPTRLSP